MAADERNFRSLYYEKVGFRNVEEKNPLDILLKEKSLDKSKLNHFCLRFPVPGMHRRYLWKILLGVLPLQVPCHDYVWSCREQAFNNLARQMEVLRLKTESAPHNIVVMWLLETGRVPTGCKDPLTRNLIYENFAKLAAMMMEFFENDVEVYWVSKAFFNFLFRLAIEMPKLTDNTYSLLEKEDADLYNFMVDKELMSNLPLFDWYTSMFAIVLNESSLCKIWDKMVGGSYKILVFVAVSLCVTLKKSIVASDTLDNLLANFENISEEMSELVVTKALDLWQQHSNLINIGLDFNIKHNPTALWAAQQSHSSSNLASALVVNSGYSERRASLPPRLDVCYSLGDYSQTDAEPFSTIPPAGDQLPQEPVTYDVETPDSPVLQVPSPVLLKHVDAMAKILKNLSLEHSHNVLQAVSVSSDDEPWSRPSRVKKSVSIDCSENSIVILDEPYVADPGVKGCSVDIESCAAEEAWDRRDLYLKVALLLSLNGVMVVLIILLWLVFLT